MRVRTGLCLLLMLFVGVGLATAQVQPPRLTTCDYEHFHALFQGGTLILDCDGTLLLPPETPILIGRDSELAAAAGRSVTFDARQAGRIFEVQPGVTFDLDHVTLTGGDVLQGGGSAILNQGGTVTLGGVRITDCSGGAVRNAQGGTLLIAGSILSGNSTFGSGGAVLNEAGGTLTVTGSTFSDNQTFGGGAGAAIANQGELAITGSTFSGNTGQGRFSWGGAIHNSGGQLTVVNSTFSANRVTHSGGAIRNDAGGRLTVTHSTFYGNEVEVWGGAIYSESGAVQSISDSLFAANVPNDCQGEGFTLDHNLGADGCGDLPATGVLPLADNGGGTWTHALAQDSNAIDTAASCPESSVDQRGVARPYGSACDIGAFEWVDWAASVVDLDACTVTTTHQVRLRDEPSTAAAIVARLPYARAFEASQTVPGWYRVRYGAVEGWVSADYLTLSEGCQP